MDDYSAYVPDVHFELIPIKNLVSNQDYQRTISVNHIKRTSENFDLYQINPVKVSRRDGINYVFNGQHTIEIVATVSGSRETPVWCMVYDDMGYTVEADVFANQQKYVKPLSPYEIFVANIEAGNEKQLIIRDLVESYHLTISGSKTPNGICAVSALEWIMDKYGFHVLDRTLRLLISTWEGEPYSLTSNMLRGIARLIVTYGDDLKDERFKERVGSFSAKEISRTAKERKAGSLGFSEALLIAYNRRTKVGALKWSRLYDGKARPEMDTEDFDEDETEESDQEPAKIIPPPSDMQEYLDHPEKYDKPISPWFDLLNSMSKHPYKPAE